MHGTIISHQNDARHNLPSDCYVSHPFSNSFRQCVLLLALISLSLVAFPCCLLSVACSQVSTSPFVTLSLRSREEEEGEEGGSLCQPVDVSASAWISLFASVCEHSSMHSDDR